MTHNNPAAQQTHAIDPELLEIIDGSGFVSIDHYYAITALHQLRLVAERELMRLSWLMAVPLVPAAMYEGTVRRVIADALGGVWGDFEHARNVLSPELYIALLNTIDGMPMSNVDWAMRVLALATSAPQPEAA